MGLKGGLAQDAGRAADPLQRRHRLEPDGRARLRPEDPAGTEPDRRGSRTAADRWYAHAPVRLHAALPAGEQHLHACPNPGAPWDADAGRRCDASRRDRRASIEPDRARASTGASSATRTPTPCPGGVDGGPATSRVATTGTRTRTTAIAGHAGHEPVRLRQKRTHNTQLSRPGDPRIVTIFLTTTESFTGSGQNTFPIIGFVEFYVTGYGRHPGERQPQRRRSVPREARRRPISTSRAGTPAATRVWGHFVKHAVPAPAQRGAASCATRRQLHALRARPGRIASAGGAVWGG